MEIQDTTRFKQELLADLRVELMALHLGDDALVDKQVAAVLLGISSRQLERLMKAGEIAFGRIGGSPRFSLGQIRRYMRDTIRRGS